MKENKNINNRTTAFKKIFPNSESLDEVLPPEHPVQRLKSLTKEADELWDSLQTPEGREKWRIPSKGFSLLDNPQLGSPVMGIPSITSLRKKPEGANPRFAFTAENQSGWKDEEFTKTAKKISTRNKKRKYEVNLNQNSFADFFLVVK